MDIFADDLARVLESALGQGITKLIIPGVDVESSRKAIELAHRYPFIFAAVGIHPEAISDLEADSLEQIEVLAMDSRVVAIGEIGLDYHYTQENHIEQSRLFEAMLAIAKSTGKPVIVHSRDAMADTLDILDKWQSEMENGKESSPYFNHPGVLHAFEGNLEQADRAVQMNFCLGAGGSITYKNAHLKHEVFSHISIDRLLLETDSPYLPPHPFRGTRNEPARLPLIADYLAQLKKMPFAEVAECTTRNADQIFTFGKTN